MRWRGYFLGGLVFRGVFCTICTVGLGRRQRRDMGSATRIQPPNSFAEELRRERRALEECTEVHSREMTSETTSETALETTLETSNVLL
ncbi:hypothetical protein B0H19DRAFT_1130276 [Mycena capillaripes]|nr:hypothetical protein B0H19DRAFT_1130276 [Mycena capillaripes]